MELSNITAATCCFTLVVHPPLARSPHRRRAVRCPKHRTERYNGQSRSVCFRWTFLQHMERVPQKSSPHRHRQQANHTADINREGDANAGQGGEGNADSPRSDDDSLATLCPSLTHVAISPYVFKFDGRLSDRSMARSAGLHRPMHRRTSAAPAGDCPSHSLTARSDVGLRSTST